MENLQYYYEKAYDLVISIVPQLLWSIVILLVGFWIIKLIIKVMHKGMTRAKMDVSLQKFLESLTNIVLKILLLISVASMLGIATTSFVAIIGAAGLAVGLALQGSLANFAGGVLILIFRPFRIGEVIETQGFIGKVEEIQVFNTVLKTPDNKTIIIPNGPLSNGSIVNYSTETNRRVDMTFGIGYEDDISKAKAILKQLVQQDPRVLKQPEAQVLVSELADSSVNFAVRAWVKGSDYWDLYFDMQEKVKTTFDKENISIPFPQQDVHLFQNKQD